MRAVSFDEAIAHTPLGEGRYLTSTPPEWLATSRSPGGLVGAQLFTGLQAMVPDRNFRPRSMTVHLLRAPEDSEYEVHVDVLRAGRTFMSLSGSVIQNGKLIAIGLGGFGTDRPSPEFDEMPMPTVEPPSPGRETEAYVPEFAFPFGNNVVLQDRLGPAPFTAPDGPMESVGWAWRYAAVRNHTKGREHLRESAVDQRASPGQYAFLYQLCTRFDDVERGVIG